MLTIFLCWFIGTCKNVYLPTSSCCPQERKSIGAKVGWGDDLKDVGILMLETFIIVSLYFIG